MRLILAWVLLMSFIPLTSADSFELDRGENFFEWRISSEINISKVMVTAPEDIETVNKTITGENITIFLNTTGLEEGVYVISAQLIPEDPLYSDEYEFATVLVDMVSGGELDEEISDLEGSIDDKIDAIGDKIVLQKSEIKGLKGRINSLEDDFEKQAGTLDNLTNRVDALDFRLKLLKKELNETSEDGTTITGNIILNSGLLGLAVIALFLIFYKRKGLKRLVKKYRDNSWKHKIDNRQNNRI